MSAYADSAFTPLRTFTEREQLRLLKTTGEHRDGYRDHVLYSLALSTALREHELVALNVGDVLDTEGRARRRVPLHVFKRSNPDESMQEVVLSDTVRAKLEKLYRWKKAKGESIAPNAPLFVSRKSNRLSTRQVRHGFGVWQERAGIERPLGFHGLRHSSCTNIFAQTKDIKLTQRFARHKSILSTARYTHPSDEALLRAVQTLPC